MSGALQFVQQNLETILAIIGGIATWLIARPWAQAKKAEAEKIVADNNLQSAQALATSVAQRIYQDVVRPAIAAGKRDDDAKRAALTGGVSILKEEIKAHGLEVAEAVLPGLIQKAVNALKSDGAAAKG